MVQRVAFLSLTHREDAAACTDFRDQHPSLKDGAVSDFQMVGEFVIAAQIVR